MVLHKQNNEYILRKPKEISEIESNIRDWRHFFNTYSPTEEVSLTGQLPNKENKNIN